jgi:outer membrane receptor protein involved in Fe transport
VWSVERIGETGELPRVREARGGIGLADTWYASSDLEIFGRLFATGATDFGGALNAQTSAAWGASDRLTLRASLSRSQRTPSPEELYLFFDHTEVGYQITGNPDLRPEDLYSAQLGGVWTSADQRLGVEVMAFHHYIDDVIVTVATEDSSNLFTYRNLGRGQTAGLQLQLQGHDLPWGMAMLANYTFMPLARTLPGGEPLPNRSAHSARAELRRRWGRGRVETWVDVTARSAMSTPEGTPNAPAFALVGAGASWKTSFGMQLMLDINNILDQTHPTWGPMPGFHALLGVRVGHDFGAGSGAGSARAEADD